MKNLFKALDDVNRRQILELLKDGDMTAGEISEKFNMTKPSISYHLDLLRQGKLVVSIKKGQYVYYSLNTSVLDDTVKWFFKLTKSKLLADKKKKTGGNNEN
jgi:ArsR family transcriptional regulator, arsenate/arsenite/antimonite-responsive transcriptional repressor